MGLESYIETAIAPGECELLMLRRSQFERLFRRKYAAQTLEKLREAQAQKLCLYIYQSDPSSVEFLKFLNMRLMDSSVLQEVTRTVLVFRLSRIITPSALVIVISYCSERRLFASFIRIGKAFSKSRSTLLALKTKRQVRPVHLTF